jgi:hypothetical protein
MAGSHKARLRADAGGSLPHTDQGDLLPVKALDASTTLELLMGRLDRQKCSMDSAAAVAGIVDRQLRLEGTLTLHSETAKKNGGDYDFDWICAVEGTRFPLFVEDRFGYTPCGKTPRTSKARRSPRGGICRKSPTRPRVMRSGPSPTSRRRAWRQAGPISRTVARSNCKSARPAQMGGRAESGGDWQDPSGSWHCSVAQAQAYPAGFRSSVADSGRPDGQNRRTLQPRSEGPA